MAFRFASLGSGSSGNGLVVERGATRVLLDCGFTLGETKLRLERLGLSPGDITAIVVTHEHSDHLGGAGQFDLGLAGGVGCAGAPFEHAGAGQ